MQRSQCLVGYCWVPLGGRLSEIESVEEAEREEEEEGEEEEEEESPKELESEEEEITIAGAGGLGFLRYWLWEEEGVRCEVEPIRGEVK